MLFLDLSKAFDTVNHKILLEKFRHLGFRWSATSWLRSYLCGRYQVTKIDGTLSREEVKCGVPQDSILGSLLFTMYINDLPSNISLGNSFIYADDTVVVLCDKDPVQLQHKSNIAMNDLHT